ncbi:uncharacterized protein LOC112560673 [Pomacea canaliculata]|uniref:uncharacterized protein LOC112560673 n=1 Tax=Pomacea canaliculata TaxID=400727 RepID=UPI000D7300B4|nr:uncharacterized protein LOC112560673 [Pomacea canaliculata]
MGTFTLTGGTCSTRYDVCSTRMRERIIVDDPSCLPGTSLQNPTTMDCVYFVSENDASYLMTYDSTRGGFSFTCSAFSTSDQEVYMTHQKDVCDGIKLPTASSSSFILSPDALCPLVEDEEEEEDKADDKEDGRSNIVIPIVIAAVLLVLLAVVVGLLCRKVKTKRQQKKVADGGAGHRSGPSDGASDVNGGLCVKE